MRLESVIISGFRCFGPRPITMAFAPDITAVVGPNAAGKTAWLHGLSKLFGVTRAQRTVQRSDFHVAHDADPDDPSPKALLRATGTGSVDPSLQSLLQADHIKFRGDFPGLVR